MVGSKKIMAKVLARVGKVSATGVGAWEPAWIHTKASHDAFMEALAEWEEADVPETRDAVRDTSDAWVQAWKEASEMYREHHSLPQGDGQ